ncbi:MAG: phosphoribosyltransferase [Mycobacterium sp.]
MTQPGDFPHRTPTRLFTDRRAAGRVLAEQLSVYRDNDDLLVLGLARGGIPVGWEVAAALRAPFDVFLVRKLGVPQWTELAMGALTDGGRVAMNDSVVAELNIGDDVVRSVIERESAELRRRERVYRGDRPAIDVQGRVVILVDDGIATGASMLASVRAVRSADPASIVVAVPVGPMSVCRKLAREADDVVCASMPSPFDSVGQAYLDFRQVGDDEVTELLATATVGGG